MSAVDDAIKDVGLAVTIIRSAGNIDTYAYVSPKIQKYHERDALFPTDSGVTDGDLLQTGNYSFLVRSIMRDERAGEFFMYRIKLFHCNATIAVKEYNSTTKTFTTVKSNVPCCIIDDASAMSTSDRAVVMPGYAGRDNLYYLYVQSSAGITKNSILVDENNRSLRVSGSINPYSAKGLLEVPVKLES